MRTVLLVMAVGTAAHAGRVVVLTERTDLPAALQAQHVDAVAEPLASAPGEQVIERAASAQHVALTNDASAAVWVDDHEVWVVSADGLVVRHAHLADPSNARAFAALAASLLDADSAVRVSLDVAPPPPVAVAMPAGAGVVASAPPPEPAERHRSPRFDISGGGFIGQRGMGFGAYPGATSTPSYPASELDGLGFRAAVFPDPESPDGDALTGWGATFELQHSIGASVDANDMVNDTYGSYGLDYTAWELGAHYRHQMGRFLLGGMASYGRATWTLAGDFPASVAIPNTDYQYLGAGANIELTVAARSTIGIGARYMYLLSTGDVSDMQWYGASTGLGVGLDADFTIPVAGAMYLRGVVEYRRVLMSFDGDGVLSAPGYSAVSSITDSWMMAGTQIGTTF